MKKNRRKRQNHMAVPVSFIAPAPTDFGDKRHLDELLDEALQESFPASDAPSLQIEQGRAKQR